MSTVAADAISRVIPITGGRSREIRWIRFTSLVLLVGALWTWSFRTTGAISGASFALLAGLALVCAAVGDVLSRLCERWIEFQPGLALELLVAFLACNTGLFLLTLASPFGIRSAVAVIAIVGVACGLFGRLRPHAVKSSLQAESGSLACIAFSLAAATVWTRDQQPISSIAGDQTVFNAWGDLFIHVRQITMFAHAHGIGTVEDIRLAGMPARVYHYASYMVPALLDRLTATSAVDAYASFQLPFGIFLTGIAAYVLTSVLLRTTWPAVVGSAVLLAMADAYGQGFGVRLLSFHFMTQVNLGMLYGLACMSMAWLFMIEGCRRGQIAAIGIAYAFLVICLTYKAHLFVANALPLMLYPCIFFEYRPRSFRWSWRLAAAVASFVLFVGVVAVSQQLPRVPTLRLDADGLRAYTDILLNSFSEGSLKRAFEAAYHRSYAVPGVHRLLATLLILVGSFGVWTLLTPVACWINRTRFEPRTIAFVALVLANYVVMSTGLALDEHGVGSREEFLNRPHAWAYFVVVVFSAAGLAMAGSRGRRPSSPKVWTFGVVAAFLALVSIGTQSRGLETFPEWPGYATYAEINGVPTCLVRAARYVRDHDVAYGVVQDSRSDPSMAFSGIAERRIFVSRREFGNESPKVAERVANVEAAVGEPRGARLDAWARSNRVDWLLLRPEDSRGKDPEFLARAAYRCGGFSLFRFE